MSPADWWTEVTFALLFGGVLGLALGLALNYAGVLL